MQTTLINKPRQTTSTSKRLSSTMNKLLNCKNKRKSLLTLAITTLRVCRMINRTKSSIMTISNSKMQIKRIRSNLSNNTMSSKSRRFSLMIKTSNMTKRPRIQTTNWNSRSNMKNLNNTMSSNSKRSSRSKQMMLPSTKIMKSNSNRYTMTNKSNKTPIMILRWTTTRMSTIMLRIKRKTLNTMTTTILKTLKLCQMLA